MNGNKNVENLYELLAAQELINKKEEPEYKPLLKIFVSPDFLEKSGVSEESIQARFIHGQVFSLASANAGRLYELFVLRTN
jgi:hypothetical protein